MSRRTRNWLIILVLIPAVAWGAAKAVIWYNVKDALDDARAALSPVATLEYSRILSPVFGPFGATGIRIQPHIVDQEITIGSALVHIDDLVEKYNFLRAAMRDTIPTRVNFSLNGARVPLGGDMAEWFERAAAPPGSMAAASGVCETGSPFTAAGMKKIGYDELVGNVILDYAYDRRGGGLVVYLKLEAQEMVEVTLEGKVPATEVAFSVERINGVPSFSDLTVTMRDLSWSARYNAYCARETGVSESRFAEARLEETRQSFLAAGFQPSEELMRALEQFAAGTAPLSVSFNPREPLDVSKVSLSEDPKFLIDSLGIEVAVDGKPLSNLGTVREQPQEEVKQAKIVDETYKLTPIAELPQYITSRIEIYTTDGKVHEGYLDSIDTGRIVLTQHLVGGSATFDVARSEVDRILVLRP